MIVVEEMSGKEDAGELGIARTDSNEFSSRQQLARWILFLILCGGAGAAAYAVLDKSTDDKAGADSLETFVPTLTPTRSPTKRPTIRPTDPENILKMACDLDQTRVWINSTFICKCAESWPKCQTRRTSPCCLEKKVCAEHSRIDPKYGFRYRMDALEGSASTVCVVAGNFTLGEKKSTKITLDTFSGSRKVEPTELPTKAPSEKPSASPTKKTITDMSAASRLTCSLFTAFFMMFCTFFDVLKN